VPLEPVAIDSSYDFILYDSNRLVIPGDSASLRAFAEKWHRVTSSRRGHLNIVQIGSSHVQGGTFPHRIRRNVLLPYVDFLSDRGMLFPYSAAVKCNNPFDYKVGRSRVLDLTRNVYKEPMERLGLCGIAVTAADSAAEVAIRLADEELPFTTRRIVLFGEARGEVMPMLRYTNDDGDSLKIAPVGVDTMLRRYTFQLPKSLDSFDIVMPCDSGEAFAITGVYLANGRPGISYHSIGVNGAALGDYLNKCPYFVRDLSMMPPDLVIFGIGINDASGPNFDTVTFQNSYLRLVDSIRSVNPDCAFIFVTNNDSYRKAGRKRIANSNGALARDAFYRIARRTGGAVWDQYAIMGGSRSIDKWHHAGLAQRDRVHFTRAGYELVGDLLSNALFDLLRFWKPAEPVESRRESAVESPAADSQPTNERALYRRRTTGDHSAAPQSENPNTNSVDERFRYISY